MKTAVQLYSLRDLPGPLARTLERVGSAGSGPVVGFDGIEFAGVGDDPEAVADALADTGLDVVGAHVPIADLRTEPGSVVAEYGELGCDHLVVPSLPPDRFADRDAVVEVADELSTLASDLPADVTLSYHNHEHEFVPISAGDVDGAGEDVVAADEKPAAGDTVETDVEESPLDILASSLAPDVGLELDVGWAVAAGADPAALLERHTDRVDLVHLKDVVRDQAAEGGASPVDLGAGHVPLDSVLTAARDADVECVVVEHDDPGDPAAWLSASATWLDGRR